MKEASLQKMSKFYANNSCNQSHNQSLEWLYSHFLVGHLKVIQKRNKLTKQSK